MIVSHPLANPRWEAGGKAFLNELWVERVCTGIQVVAVFAGMILPLPKISWRRKLFAVVLVAIAVHFANIACIALEIWLLYSGLLPWDLAHYPTGLILGIFSVAFLVIATDYFVPEFGDLIMASVARFRRA